MCFKENPLVTDITNKNWMFIMAEDSFRHKSDHCEIRIIIQIPSDDKKRKKACDHNGSDNDK